MNTELQQQQQLPPVNHNRVVVIENNTILEPSYPKERRRKYERRNSKVGRMFFESAVSTTLDGSTSTPTYSNSTSSEVPIVAPTSTLTTTTMTVNVTDTSLKPLCPIIRPSKYGTTHAKTAISQSSPVHVEKMRESWGHVPQLSASSMSSIEEEENQKRSLSRTPGGEDFTTTGCLFASSLTDYFCYDPECRFCCESKRICIE